MSSWGSRVCCACGHDLSSSEYSRNQWAKGVGMSRCSECVSECVRSDADSFGAARFNETKKFSVNVNQYDEEGSAKYCSYGRYTGGLRTGQRCVAKWYKDGGDHFANDLNAVNKTEKIVTQWNQAFGDNFKVRINIPETAIISDKCCLVEPFIEGFFKINSNTGWTTAEVTDEVLKLHALSHYSYHVSSGQFLLCDLQGGIYRDFIVLTDPVIMSRDCRFGLMDLGPRGMSTFFYHHTCNHFCRREWTRPRDQHDYFARRMQTTVGRWSRSRDSRSDSGDSYSDDGRSDSSCSDDSRSYDSRNDDDSRSDDSYY
jgi:hypothetical protein